MKESCSPRRKESEGADAPAGRGQFKLNIDIAHSWEPDYATKANVLWWGEVLLERIESGKRRR